MELTAEERQLVLTSLWLFRTRIAGVFSRAAEEDVAPDVAEHALRVIDLIESTVTKLSGSSAHPGYGSAD